MTRVKNIKIGDLYTKTMHIRLSDFSNHGLNVVCTRLNINKSDAVRMAIHQLIKEELKTKEIDGIMNIIEDKKRRENKNVIDNLERRSVKNNTHCHIPPFSPTLEIHPPCNK